MRLSSGERTQLRSGTQDGTVGDGLVTRQAGVGGIATIGTVNHSAGQYRDLIGKANGAKFAEEGLPLHFSLFDDILCLVSR